MLTFATEAASLIEEGDGQISSSGGAFQGGEDSSGRLDCPADVESHYSSLEVGALEHLTWASEAAPILVQAIAGIGEEVIVDCLASNIGALYEILEEVGLHLGSVAVALIVIDSS